MKKKLTTVDFRGTAEQEAKLLEVIAKYDGVQGKLMPILQEAQEIYGYLPVEVQKIIADTAGSISADAIAAYNSLERYASSTGGYIFGGTQATSYYLDRISNPDLTWEKTASYNVGLDFGIFDDRISITAISFYPFYYLISER